MNRKLILRLTGTLLIFESAAFAMCMAVSLYYGEAAAAAFVASSAATAAAGMALRRAGRNAKTVLTRYDSFAVVIFSWLSCTVAGMLPYLFSGGLSTVTDAFFEAMSGLTSTGMTVIDDLDSLPRGMHFWRCMSNWIGGMGIVVFTLALLPSGSAGETKLFSAEMTGPRKDKLHPRFKTTMRWILSVYLLLTASCAAALYLAGMDAFDSICHSFSTAGTGGFSTHSASIAYYNSPAIEYVVAAFMFVSGMNFTMLYTLLFRRKFKAFFTNSEIKAYVFVTAAGVAAVCACLYFGSGLGFADSARQALFHVVSMETTTGFLSADITQWMPFTWIILSMAMFAGGCAGSTSGGFKVVRLVALFKITRNEFKYMLHPRAVIPVRINNSPMSYSMEHTLLSFATLYAVFVAAGVMAFSLAGVPLSDALSISLTSVSNTGPEMGSAYGPLPSWSVMPGAAKWACAALMFAGRLEIFTIIILFVPRFWKDY